MNLRIDDKPIIKWLHKYFGVGRIVPGMRAKSPYIKYEATNLYDILASIVPHFEKYKLRAKKKMDYEVWVEMVKLQAIWYRKKWSKEVRNKMKRLYLKLKNGRKLILG